jgi:hypothetical protein
LRQRNRAGQDRRAYRQLIDIPSQVRQRTDLGGRIVPSHDDHVEISSYLRSGIL